VADDFSGEVGIGTSSWPKQDPGSVKRLRALSEAEIQANGWGSQPYHPTCRGQLVLTGTVRQVVDETKVVAPRPSH
jgi:hypothetical protein